MDQQNSINVNDYLVTQPVTPTTLSKVKLSGDMDILQKAESRANYKEDITKGVKDVKEASALSALKLVNPFKGY